MLQPQLLLCSGVQGLPTRMDRKSRDSRAEKKLRHWSVCGGYLMICPKNKCPCNICLYCTSCVHYTMHGQSDTLSTHQFVYGGQTVCPHALFTLWATFWWTSYLPLLVWSALSQIFMDNHPSLYGTSTFPNVVDTPYLHVLTFGHNIPWTIFSL